jgi:hypothetical protein
MIGWLLRSGERERLLRIFLVMTLTCLSACSWFTSRKTHSPDPTEIVVTGAPAGSVVFVDGTQAGTAAVRDDRPQVLNVAAGSHKVEIHVGDAVVYREDTYVGLGEHRMVRVLSGLSR